MTNDRIQWPRQLAKLSQVFLKDRLVGEQVCEELQKNSCQRVIEIGPGPGILTSSLLDAGLEVIAIEKDQRFVDYLSEHFRDEVESGQLKLVSNSILHEDLSKYDIDALVGNIPYHISSDILQKYFEVVDTVPLAIFLVQKEFAERLAACEGNKLYGRLSIFAQMQSKVNILQIVAKERFSPVPRVDSALVSLARIENQHPKSLIKKVEEITQVCFSLRRKKISNSLGKRYSNVDFEGLGIDMNSRCESLSVDDFVRLANHLLDVGNS